jgi:hypothetical protein
MNRTLATIALLLALAFAVTWRPPTTAPPVNDVRVASRIIIQNKAKYHQWRRETIFRIRDNRRVHL